MRHLRIYRAIQYVVEEGSIRKAAEKLTISPSALNRSIQAYETELGADIFDRVAGGVRLSVAGELIIRPILEHLAQMDDFLNTLSDLQGGHGGTLRLSVAADLWPGIAEGVAEQFRRTAPNIDLDVTVANDATLLRARQVDLALTTVPHAEDDLEILVAARAPVRGFCAADLEREKQEFALVDLPDHHLMVPPQGTGLRQSVDHILRISGLKPRGLHTLPTPPLTLRDAPNADIALTLHPHSPKARPNWREIDITGLRLAPVQISLLVRQSGPLSRNAERFTTIAGAVLDGLEG